ncbi:MAG TPA: Gfo/Idh/MocA family oxidoreductase, partial [Gaiellaceae bacterium]|nr:Gfo/Idh/MocA family oxidoreductase [Gaiellaceae bacterium]
PVRLAVAGRGYWGPNLVRNLYENPSAEVVRVCDLRPEQLSVLKGRYPGIARTTRFEDLLEDRSIEAIVLCTPVSTHYPLALAALEAGKHVFVEKPIASSSAEAAELVELAQEKGLVVMPGHTFLYSPPVNTIRTLIDSDELGDIYFISTSRVNLGLHQSDVSVAWDLGPHDFSILRYLLDESPTHVTALSRACVIPGTPDVAFINLEFASGAIAHVELSWLAPSKLRRTTIVGSRKMVVYDDTSNEPVRIFDSGASLPNPETFGEYKMTYRTGDIVSPRIEVAEPLYLELADFCSSIRSKTQPRSSAQLGLEVVRVVEAVDASLAQNGARVEVANDAALAAA